MGSSMRSLNEGETMIRKDEDGYKPSEWNGKLSWVPKVAWTLSFFAKIDRRGSDRLLHLLHGASPAFPTHQLSYHLRHQRSLDWHCYFRKGSCATW